ncbi:hypothetical protein [Butyrivibrio sp. INlla14]|uniref:hypothetical protein n=1 Tax=Butyrivibrio sp. INlla14 TaxID=1520808 RepID=UPI000876006B|nr:hypothetical protein [Butyrivibrio sp. INlla14]SCY16391.1 hypothetical protein SAMN02910371_01301 [Butyrivibrio sp. INlla14]
MWDEDEFFFNRHDSASDSVSSSAAGALGGLAAIPIALVLSAVGILIMRIDILNAASAGFIPLFLTRNMGLDSKTCLIIYGVTVIATLILEHCFTVAKILGSIIGCLVVAFLCYELSDVTPMNTRLTITGVGTVITILLNIRFWKR